MNVITQVVTHESDYWWLCRAARRGNPIVVSDRVDVWMTCRIAIRDATHLDQCQRLTAWVETMTGWPDRVRVTVAWDHTTLPDHCVTAYTVAEFARACGHETVHGYARHVTVTGVPRDHAVTLAALLMDHLTDLM